MYYVHLSEVYFQRNVEAKTLKIVGKLNEVWFKVLSLQSQHLNCKEVFLHNFSQYEVKEKSLKQTFCV